MFRTFAITLLVLATALPAVTMAQAPSADPNASCPDSGVPGFGSGGTAVDLNGDGTPDACINSPDTSALPDASCVADTADPTCVAGDGGGGGGGGPPPADAANPTVRYIKVYPHGAARTTQATALRAKVDFVVNATDDVNVTSLKLLDNDGTQLNESHTKVLNHDIVFVVDTKKLVEGPHEFKAVATDGAGKTGDAKLSIRVDNSPPAKPAIALGAAPTGQAGWYVKPVQVALSDVGDAQSAVSLRYTVNRGAEKTYNGPFSLSGIGVANLTVIASDDAGNRANASRLIKLDTSDPVMAFVSRPVNASALSAIEIRVNVTSGAPPTSVQVKLDGAATDATREANSTIYRAVVMLSAAQAGHSVQYVVTVTDEAGRNATSEAITLAVGAASSLPTGTDTDGDGISDSQEVLLGTDPKDVNSPAFKATVPTIERLANGTMKITWTAPTTAKVDRFLVFRFSDPVLVGEVVFVPGKAAYTLYDTHYPGGTHTYAVQTKLATDPLKSYNLAKASPPSAPITAQASSTTLVEPKATDALKEPWFYIGVVLLVGIVAVMVTGIVRRRDPAAT